jgi:hypothetical protein
LSLDALEGYIGERAADRLMVLCPQPLNLGTGTSYRQLQAGLL